MIATKLKYEIVDKDGFGMIILKSGNVIIKAIKRERKYFGYSGYDAYVQKENGCYPRWPDFNSSKLFVLLRKLEKVKGVELK